MLLWRENVYIGFSEMLGIRLMLQLINEFSIIHQWFQYWDCIEMLTSYECFQAKRWVTVHCYMLTCVFFCFVICWCCCWCCCRVSYIFGLIAMLAGLVGVPLGSFLGQKLRLTYPRADPLVCGAGLLLSTPFLLAGLLISEWNTTACFCVIFFGQVLLNLNWSIVADMCLVCALPSILCSYLFQ